MTWWLRQAFCTCGYVQTPPNRKGFVDENWHQLVLAMEESPRPAAKFKTHNTRCCLIILDIVEESILSNKKLQQLQIKIHRKHYQQLMNREPTQAQALEQIWFLSLSVEKQYYKQIYLQGHQWRHKHHYFIYLFYKVRLTRHLNWLKQVDIGFLPFLTYLTQPDLQSV